MNYLEKYYDVRVSELQEKDFLKQVGHTEGGKPIGAAQFQRMVQQLRELIEPNSDDSLLDLCCGNGVITTELANDVKMTVGVELSGNLVAVARKYHKGPETRYFRKDISQLSTIDAIEKVQFTKILMHGALQHFKPAEFDVLMRNILSYASPDCTIVFGFVPMNGRQRFFYNTPKRRMQAVIYKLLKRDAFGNWWDKKFLMHKCKKLGLECEITDIDKSLDASNYRCNIKITRHSKINV